MFARKLFAEIRYFKNKSFKKYILIKVGLLVSNFLQKKKLKRFDQFLMQKKDFQSQNFVIFDKVVHKFGKSDEDMI